MKDLYLAPVLRILLGLFPHSMNNATPQSFDRNSNFDIIADVAVDQTL